MTKVDLGSSGDAPTTRSALLSKHHLAVFEDRIILEAQPPIDDETLAEIARHCSGPIPEGLLDLWRTSFGGQLDYDLELTFGGEESSMSFSELFYPKSRDYHDLWGWIEHEEGLAEQSARDAGAEWSGKLDYLPFGGFEYLERYYVCVAPGPDRGAVFVWQRGLPPAWVLRRHRDTSARVADDVHALFRMLDLARDPESTPPDKHPSGVTTLEHLDELGEDGDAGRALADELVALLKATIRDWRVALEAGTLAQSARLRRLAVSDAIETDDVALLERLAASGCDLAAPVRGEGHALDLALACGSMKCVAHLLERRLPVKNAIRNGAGTISLELAKELLARGAEPDATAVLTATREGALEVAVAIARALFATRASDRTKLIADAKARAGQEEDSAARVESGKMGSNMTPAEYRERANRYRTLAARLKNLER